MSAWKRPRVALLFAGGTAIGGTACLNRGVRRPEEVKDWLRDMGEIEMIAEIEPRLVVAEGRTVGVTEWTDLVRAIMAVYDQVEGIVILHTPGSAPLTAAALEAMMQSGGKPIVVAPGRAEGEPGGRSNIINALQTATADLAGVFYVQGSHIINAATIKNDKNGAVTGQIVGKIDFGLRLFKRTARANNRTARFITKMQSRVEVIDLIPNEIRHPRMTKAVGVVLVRDQMAPATAENLRSWQTASRFKGPVVVVGGAGEVNMPNGWINQPDMPSSVAAVRLMAALAVKSTSWRKYFQRYKEAKP